MTAKSNPPDLQFAYGWAVWWYFIPIATLWKPYQYFKIIYRVSVNHSAWKQVQIPNILFWWWFLWILTMLISNVRNRFSFDTDFISSVDNLQVLTISYIATTPIELLLNFVFLKIVTDISGRHNGTEFQKLLK